MRIAAKYEPPMTRTPTTGLSLPAAELARPSKVIEPTPYAGSSGKRQPPAAATPDADSRRPNRCSKNARRFSGEA